MDAETMAEGADFLRKQRREERGQLSYDGDQGGHVCTAHGPTIDVDRSVEPTESGSWYYRCRVCGASGWSGL